MVPPNSSTPFNPATPHRVIYKLRELKGVDELGGTMRLGAWTCVLNDDSFAKSSYGSDEISERHRHRYEFSNDFRDKLVEAGMILSGTSPDKRLVEMIELRDHPFFVGCQFHPEFKSRPVAPHPLFARFVRAALERATARGKTEVRKQSESHPVIN
jgi:CTP synthase